MMLGPDCGRTPAFLLGAGASKDAGLPLASEITGKAIKHINESGPQDRTIAPLLNYVVSAIVAHQGRSGSRPDRLPDIETVVAAVDLLAQRSDLEITPFVKDWDPAANLLGGQASASRLPKSMFRDVQGALLKDRAFGEDALVKVIDRVVDTRDGTGNSGAYQRLNAALIQDLVRTLSLESETRVHYFDPLIRLCQEAKQVTIATLNYDLTVETAAKASNVPLSTGMGAWEETGKPHFPPSGPILVKLHGSIGWRDTGQTRTELMLPSDGFDPRPPEQNELPAVIYGRRGKLRADGPYLSLRATFESRLSATDALVCIGYSFKDDHVNSIIRQWLNGASDRWLVVVDPDPVGFAHTFYDASFAAQLQRLNPKVQHFRANPQIRPRVYPLPMKAVDAMERVCQPSDRVRATFEDWEADYRERHAL